ncbi:MAG: helix-turn-helix domain-containing protein [Pseudomonas sp.]
MSVYALLIYDIRESNASFLDGHLMEYRQAFGETLRELRWQFGLTQEAFLGVAAISTISRIERGVQLPSFDMIVQFATILKIDTITLLMLAETKKQGFDTPDEVIKRVIKQLKPWSKHVD